MALAVAVRNRSNDGFAEFSDIEAKQCKIASSGSAWGRSTFNSRREPPDALGQQQTTALYDDLLLGAPAAALGTGRAVCCELMWAAMC